MENGADINARDNGGGTALNHACRENKPRAVRRLLPKAEVNMGDNLGYNGLLWASIVGGWKICKMLIEAGADVKVKGGDSVGALHYCAENGSKETVKALLEKGAEVDDLDYRKRTALHFAVSSGHLELAEYLLEQGAGIDIQDVDGDSPLMLAAKMGHVSFQSLPSELCINVQVQIHVCLHTDTHTYTLDQSLSASL